MVNEFADGDRSGTTSAETQEEKEEVEIVTDCFWPKAALQFCYFRQCECPLSVKADVGLLDS